MTGQDLIAEILNTCQMDASLAANRSQVLLYLNRAKTDIAIACGWDDFRTYLASAITTSVGLASYSLPSDCLRIIRIKCVTTGYRGDMTEYEQWRFDDDVPDETIQGIPKFYRVAEASLGVSTVRFYPVPDAVYVYDLWYYRMGIALADDATAIDMSDPLQELLLQGGLWRMMRTQGYTEYRDERKYFYDLLKDIAGKIKRSPRVYQRRPGHGILRGQY